ncbi:MAG: tRNA lysidine(34) synthetase TilS [Candidatus Saccharimonadales bacterium]
MRYIVAVSGGIDSVVLLHQLVTAGEHELIVAHFDHGIRDDSADDARFVQALADQYGLPFVTRREELGAHASEAFARERRYRFLRQVAVEHHAQIVTAHHSDDVIETIAINLTRGTGWRGVAVLNSPDIERPLVYMSKSQLRQYAHDYRLEWVEDSTNATPAYLRNRIRQRISRMIDSSAHQQLAGLRIRQCEIKREIETEVAVLVGEGPEYSRYLLTAVDGAVACELLRAVIVRQQLTGLTRPQLEQAILAIKTARPGTKYQAGDGIELRFTKRTFTTETLE